MRANSHIRHSGVDALALASVVANAQQPPAPAAPAPAAAADNMGAATAPSLPQFKVFQFPPDQIPRIDGKDDDWAIVPDSYAITLADMHDDEHKHPAPDPKDLDVKVKVGWVKGLNRLYFLYEAYDNFWDFADPGLHNDTFEVVVGRRPFGRAAHPALPQQHRPERVGRALLHARRASAELPHHDASGR